MLAQAVETIEVIDRGPSFLEQALIGLIGGLAGAGGGAVVVRGWIGTHRRDLRIEMLQAIGDTPNPLGVLHLARQCSAGDTRTVERWALAWQEALGTSDLERSVSIVGRDANHVAVRLNALRDVLGESADLQRFGVVLRLERLLSTGGPSGSLWWFPTWLKHQRQIRSKRREDREKRRTSLEGRMLTRRTVRTAAAEAAAFERVTIPADERPSGVGDQHARALATWLGSLPPTSYFRRPNPAGKASPR